MINKNSVNNLNWDDIFKLWESLNVPEVDFIKFQFKPKTKSNKEFIKYMKQRNVGGSPWHCKKDTIIANSNIQQQTAEHLFHLKDKSDELKTAYKLNAFCVMTQSWDFSREMLNPVFLKYNQLDSRHWWAWRAKNVLPFTGLDYHFPQVNFKNWINIVNYAAKEWKTVEY